MAPPARTIAFTESLDAAQTLVGVPPEHRVADDRGNRLFWMKLRMA